MSSPSPPTPSRMPSMPSINFHRRRTSDRTSNDADGRPRVASAPQPVPSNMRGMRRLEMRRGMEESHYLAQKARTTTLNVPTDMRLLDYVSDYDRNLMCPICRCPLVDPVVLYDCDHCFCRDCLSQTWTEYHPGGPRGTCPTCRREAKLGPKTAVSKILTNILDELVVKCPKHEDGCTAEIKRGQVQDHVNLYCQYALVECPRVECEQTTRRKDANECLHYGASCIDCHDSMFVDNLENHWRRECADRKVICPLCDQSIFYRTLDSHTKDTCPAITTPCPGSPYGCPFRTKRGDLDSHSQSCVFAILAPTFAAQQRKIDEQEEAQKALLKKLAVLEQGFDRLETIVCENVMPDLSEPSNPADPGRIPLTLEARVRSPRHGRGASTDTDTSHTTERASMSHQNSSNSISQHTRDQSTASVLPEIDFPAPPAGRGSVMANRLSTVSSGVHSPRSSGRVSRHGHQSPDYNEFLGPDATYAQSSASPTQHLLSLHESLRDEVTRIAGALHDLDGRHSMLMLNENLRLKEDMAFLNAQVSGLGGQVGWLTNAVMARGNSASSGAASQRPQDIDEEGESGDDGGRGRARPEGVTMQNAVTALRGAARMVNLSRGNTATAGGLPRRIGSDEGRTKL